MKNILMGIGFLFCVSGCVPKTMNNETTQTTKHAAGEAAVEIVKMSDGTTCYVASNAFSYNISVDCKTKREMGQ